MIKIYKNKKIQLFFGLAIGMIFGFLLDKGGVTRYQVIIDQLLLKDFRVLKIIFSAIIVGMIGLHILRKLEIIEFNIKPCITKANIIGGLIFGVGFGLLGYCPGTAVGAIGTGSVHALVGVIGILVGSGLFASFYSVLKNNIDKTNKGKITIPEILKINPWFIVILLSILFISIFLILEKYKV